MTNSYQYSIKVNEALERYGAKTCGSLERRVARLKRFTAMTNRKYADEIRLEDERMMANQERVQNRIREILVLLAHMNPPSWGESQNGFALTRLY